MLNMGRMHGYGFKVAGMILAAIATLALIINHFLNLQVVPEFDTEQHTFMYWWLTLFGLYIMAFSKEKHDDERVQAVRAFAMRIAFTLAMASMISIALTAWLAKDMTFNAGNLLIIPTFCLLLYHIVFHLGIYFDGVFRFSNHHDYALPKGKKNKGIQYIVYFLIIAILLGMMAYEAFIAK